MTADNKSLGVHYVTNALAQSGVGHQAQEIAQRLTRMASVELVPWHIDGETGALRLGTREVASIRPWPGVFGSKSVNWIRLGRRISGKPGWISHLTNQTLSFLAKRLPPAVVTVHDIIELLEPQDKRAFLLNRYVYSGIAAASHIICVSAYTKKTVQDYYRIPDEKITVIYNGVGAEFHPLRHFKQTLAYQELRRELKIGQDDKVVLFVGSDHPRKNVVTAVRAAALAAEKIRDPLIFLKVGTPGLPAGRATLLAEVDRLRIRGSVRILEDVAGDRLNELYNVADVLIYPSRYEGFGLPPLQAMATGTPVVASNATSLPEVVGEAADMHDPDDIDGFAASLVTVMTNPAAALAWRERGLTRAAQFSWDTAAHKTLEVYYSVRP